jgi:carbon storage regulator
MLVLTRKLMEKLFIGDDICITVVRLEGGQVRLGIEAPRSVAVVRAELVPERQSAGPRMNQRPLNPGNGPHAHGNPPPPAGNGPGTVAQSPASAGRGEVRIPPTVAHENDSRRRGRSQ